MKSRLAISEIFALLAQRFGADPRQLSTHEQLAAQVAADRRAALERETYRAGRRRRSARGIR